MSVHDWTRVEAGIFYSFHTVWIGQLNTALNGGLLSDGYYALAEQHAADTSQSSPTKWPALWSLEFMCC